MNLSEHNLSSERHADSDFLTCLLMKKLIPLATCAITELAAMLEDSCTPQARSPIKDGSTLRPTATLTGQSSADEEVTIHG